MPDNIKLSLHNAIIIVGFILTVGISYSAIASRINTNEKLDESQGVRIEKLEAGAIEAQSERDEAKIHQKYTVDALRRIEVWIREIDEVRIGE